MQETVMMLLKEKGFNIWSVTPWTTVSETSQLMADKSIGAVLVMEDDQLVGILSERDYTTRMILKDRSSRDTVAEEIMTTRVIYVDPQRTVDECMALMTEHRIRHLPVVEGTKIIGVISIGDVVKAVIAAEGVLIDHLELYIMGH